MTPAPSARDQIAAAGDTDPVLRSIADGFIAARVRLRAAVDDLDEAVKTKAKVHSVARRLMTVSSVVPVNALTFIALVDVPTHVSRSSDVGAFLGPRPKRHQSGDVD